MSELPEPLVSADVELRDFPYVLVDVEAWRARFAFEDPATAVAAFRLYCMAWHELPAASVQNDDKALAVLSGLGRKWKRRREIILRGWVLCSDNRFYHPGLAAIALRAWKKKTATARKVLRRLEIESGDWALLRSAVFKRDNFTCQYCGAHGVKLECDHVIPVSSGGQTSMENLVTACKPCNRSKGSKLLGEWRQ